MEYQWSGECQHALATVQGHCLDIVEHIATTTDEITAASQHNPIITDTVADTQVAGTPIRIFFSTSYGKKHTIDCQRGTHIDDICSYVATQDNYTYAQTWTYRGKVISGTIGEAEITDEATVTMLPKAPDGRMPIHKRSVLSHNKFPEWAHAISEEPWSQSAKYMARNPPNTTECIVSLNPEYTHTELWRQLQSESFQCQVDSTAEMMAHAVFHWSTLTGMRRAQRILDELEQAMHIFRKSKLFPSAETDQRRIPQVAMETMGLARALTETRLVSVQDFILNGAMLTITEMMGTDPYQYFEYSSSSSTVHWSVYLLHSNKLNQMLLNTDNSHVDSMLNLAELKKQHLMTPRATFVTPSEMREDALCTLRLVGDTGHDAIVSGDVSGDKQWRKETVTNSEVIRPHIWSCSTCTMHRHAPDCLMTECGAWGTPAPHSVKFITDDATSRAFAMVAEWISSDLKELVLNGKIRWQLTVKQLAAVRGHAGSHRAQAYVDTARSPLRLTQRLLTHELTTSAN